jgi:hypothetical protein
MTSLIGGVVGGVIGSCAPEGVDSLSSVMVESGGGGISSEEGRLGEVEEVGVRLVVPIGGLWFRRP